MIQVLTPSKTNSRILICAVLLLLSTASYAQSPSTTEPSTAESSSAQSSSVKPLYVDRFDRDNQLLAKANPSEIRWLTTPSEKLVVLYKPGETRKTKGALLQLHASETPQRWPEPLEELRRNLPLYGWATYAVQLPSKTLPKAPARASSSESTPAAEMPASTSSAANTASSETSKLNFAASSASAQSSSVSRNQLISERVDSAIQDLNKLSIFNIIVLADNSSAPEALNGLFAKINAGTTTNQTIDGPLQALILINLQEREPLTAEQLANIFANENLPVIDVFCGVNSASIQLQRRIHKAEAMKKNLRDYQQFVLAPENIQSINEASRFWIEKIRGFMEQKAEGNEVKNPDKTKPN